jgi:hypothetical protein
MEDTGEQEEDNLQHSFLKLDNFQIKFINIINDLVYWHFVLPV